VDQGQQEYPPGTVGYLAKGRGWGASSATTSEDQVAESDSAAPARALAHPLVRARDTSKARRSTSVSERERADDTQVEPPVDRPARPEPAESGRTEDLSTEDVLTEEDDDLDVPFWSAPVEPDNVPSDTEPQPAATEPAPSSTEPAPSSTEPAPPSTEPEPTAESPPARSRWPEHRPPARWVEPGAVAAEEAQRARLDSELVAHAGDLASDRLLHPGRRPPRSGWRRLCYLLSFGLVNFGDGPGDQRQHELIMRINQPLYGCHRIAMLSLKGGVGKTTVTATLGATFASLRGDRVIAVDANPDRGTLSQKIPLETTATVRHLLRDARRIRRYTDVRAYTSQGPSRLEVLASEQDPAVSEAFSEQDYRRTVALLEHFYNIVLTDCGTGLMHSAMYGVLGLADSLVIVSSGSIDGARSASATMDWLDAHGHRELVANSVAVINSVRRGSGQVDLDRVAEHFAARCRAVVRIPYDSHLEEGAELDLDRLAPATRTALLELAAAAADAFPDAPSR
jgi:MinD-like ATPase involved in chromosome partitioning or flagellar assembly